MLTGTLFKIIKCKSEIKVQNTPITHKILYYINNNLTKLNRKLLSLKC